MGQNRREEPLCHGMYNGIFGYSPQWFEPVKLQGLISEIRGGKGDERLWAGVGQPSVRLLHQAHIQLVQPQQRRIIPRGISHDALSPGAKHLPSFKSTSNAPRFEILGPLLRHLLQLCL